MSVIRANQPWSNEIRLVRPPGNLPVCCRSCIGNTCRPGIRVHDDTDCLSGKGSVRLSARGPRDNVATTTDNLLRYYFRTEFYCIALFSSDNSETSVNSVFWFPKPPPASPYNPANNRGKIRIANLGGEGLQLFRVHYFTVYYK